MSTAFPQLSNYFGLLTGFAYTIPFAVTGVFFGKIVNKVNRKLLLGILMVLAGSTMGIAGVTTSFGVLAACRVVGAFISAGFNPLSFSLLAEYFPPERRTTANTILQSGNYMAWGLSSLSVLFIKQFGWRSTYGMIGAASALVGLSTMAFIKEPVKKVVKAMENNKKANEAVAAVDEVDPNYTPEELEEMKDKPYKYMLSNPVNKWCMLGSFIRNIGGSCITYYLPVFFLKNYPMFKAQYATANALILSGLGLLSGIIAGFVGDKFAKTNKMTNAYICMSGTSIALPLYALATLQTGNFWLSMACHAVVTLFSAAFSGSAITMM